MSRGVKDRNPRSTEGAQAGLTDRPLSRRRAFQPGRQHRAIFTHARPASLLAVSLLDQRCSTSLSHFFRRRLTTSYSMYPLRRLARRSLARSARSTLIVTNLDRFFTQAKHSRAWAGRQRKNGNFSKMATFS